MAAGNIRTLLITSIVLIHFITRTASMDHYPPNWDRSGIKQTDLKEFPKDDELSRKKPEEPCPLPPCFPETTEYSVTDKITSRGPSSVQESSSVGEHSVTSGPGSAQESSSVGKHTVTRGPSSPQESSSVGEHSVTSEPSNFTKLNSGVSEPNSIGKSTGTRNEPGSVRVSDRNSLGNTAYSVRWVNSSWSPCSPLCMGIRSRNVTCQVIDANGHLLSISDIVCIDLLGPKPELFQECKRDESYPQWIAGPWKKCDKLCGDGKQVRRVACFRNEDGIQLLDDEECTEEKPNIVKHCFLKPCGTHSYDTPTETYRNAEGPEQQGSEEECRNTQYGCCSDGVTPAHGPDGEGCCLLAAFGCCPDNFKPAEGPHLEGCGCQSTKYGCCPDQVTAAESPDNRGCGCQYTQHGCCPDRHTEATGPKYEGCTCNTLQFGCCPDGVRAAQGPDQQGCHCRYSPYGCCGDDQTPANSPDGSDCDCAASKYGCCPDGETTATGPKFHGCTDIPENKQVVCSLPADNGPCHNYTAVWFYDLTYGECSRFWYGGCEGNGNRFATKQDCEDVCIQPAPKDVCKLPAVKGPCSDDSMRWHFDSEREQCAPFSYGGCLGNANNFQTQEVCQAQCLPDTTTDQCSLPVERGSCAGNYSRWGYSREAGRCEQFAWGGCEGNANRFGSEAACRLRCSPPGALAPACTQPQGVGNCTSKEALWSFSKVENRCVPFYYSGCGGNDNRFGSRASCEQACPSAYEPNKCTLPATVGDCSEYTARWFYDTAVQGCHQFFYGGCGGNANNFETKAECDNTCAEDKFMPTTTSVPITRGTLTTTTVAPQTQPPRSTAPPQPHREVLVPAGCTDNPFFENCALMVRNNFCQHKYYGKFCCKTCVEAGELVPEETVQDD